MSSDGAETTTTTSVEEFLTVFKEKYDRAKTKQRPVILSFSQAEYLLGVLQSHVTTTALPF